MIVAGPEELSVGLGCVADQERLDDVLAIRVRTMQGGMHEGRRG